MKLAELITSILSPHLGSQHSIDIGRAEELLRDSDLDIDDVDPEGEGLAKVLADMPQSFRVEHGQEADTLVCLLPEQPSVARKPREPHLTVPPESFDTAAFNAGIADVIRTLQSEAAHNGAPLADNKVLLTELGNRLKSRGLTLPEGMKLGKYIASQAACFELTGDGHSGKYYVRNITDGIVETSTAASPVRSAPRASFHAAAPHGASRGVAAAPRSVGRGGFPAAGASLFMPHQASIYELLDFAYFDDYVGSLRSLSAMVARGSWHTLPDGGNPNPFLLLGYKLRTQFALAVEQLVGGSADAPLAITIGGATFATGLTTSDGRHVKARFAYNTRRDASRWQQYVFAGWVME